MSIRTTSLPSNGSTPNSLKIFTGTWNCAEYNPENETPKLKYDLLRFLQFNKGEECDIYVIGLQEIQMNATSMVKEETIAKSKWHTFFKNLFDDGASILQRKVQSNTSNPLNKNEGLNEMKLLETPNDLNTSTLNNSKIEQKKPLRFRDIAVHQLVGILIVVFIKEEHYLSIKNESNCKCREGALGVMGNKGSIAFRFKLYERNFIFIVMHLSAHMKNVEQRNQNLNNILSKTTFKIREAQVNVLDHDFIFLLGDFNYRIQQYNPDFNNIVKKINDDELSFLIAWDQCLTEKLKGNILHNFIEGELSFAPTFKFKIGTNEYNPKRIPSWCDRIFYQSTNPQLPIVQLSYDCSQTFLSDHKPVYSLFEVPLIADESIIDTTVTIPSIGRHSISLGRQVSPMGSTLSTAARSRATIKTSLDLDDIFGSASSKLATPSSSNMFSGLSGNDNNDLPAPIQPTRRLITKPVSTTPKIPPGARLSIRGGIETSSMFFRNVRYPQGSIHPGLQNTSQVPLSQTSNIQKAFTPQNQTLSQNNIDVNSTDNTFESEQNSTNNSENSRLLNMNQSQWNESFDLDTSSSPTSNINEISNNNFNTNSEVIHEVTKLDLFVFNEDENVVTDNTNSKISETFTEMNTTNNINIENSISDEFLINSKEKNQTQEIIEPAFDFESEVITSNPFETNLNTQQLNFSNELSQFDSKNLSNNLTNNDFVQETILESFESQNLANQIQLIQENEQSTQEDFNSSQEVDESFKDTIKASDDSYINQEWTHTPEDFIQPTQDIHKPSEEISLEGNNQSSIQTRGLPPPIPKRERSNTLIHNNS